MAFDRTRRNTCLVYNVLCVISHVVNLMRVFVKSGLTPLHVAAYMGHNQVILFLIQRGADPNAQTVRGETPLHLATRGNQVESMGILLRNGANVDAKANVRI